MRLLLLLLLMVLFTSACDNYPRDADKTLEKIKKGTLLVGYTENPPWVVKTKAEPTGLEAELIKKFAKTQDAKIVWVNDTEQDLFEQLEKRKLHLVIGGFTDKNTWKTKISFTRPYVKQQKEKHVMAVLKGENALIVALESFLHQQKSSLNALPASYEAN
ncbi:transporter substrate-binding domain-containing protein [Adhaeribacter radiodurans]|uniref:Transporter substrate-binding domain-containing protein n=1 Tax=Adhaeribacter radiodurans TaxID=2745197 RepID=A0A7L7LAZ6_9BACT|nr:transporter substrate-binding domain-containing protein [Adhaeribacter radiodurans]QMU29923.1 transporter substrate-binding domain-containing protein [Adhaeribacter radiodurans]